MVNSDSIECAKYIKVIDILVKFMVYLKKILGMCKNYQWFSKNYS